MPSAGYRSLARRHNSPEQHNSLFSKIFNLYLSYKSKSFTEVSLDNKNNIPVNTMLEEDIFEIG